MAARSLMADGRMTAIAESENSLGSFRYTPQEQPRLAQTSAFHAEVDFRERMAERLLLTQAV